MPHSNQSIKSHKLNRYGKRGVILNFFFIFISLPMLLVSSGTFTWMNGWLYFGLILVYEIIYTILLMKKNPGLLNERGKFVKEGTKQFDKVYVVLYLILTYSLIIISGLDAIRYGWSNMTLGVIFLGLIMIIPAFCFSFWAIAVNSYFECTVRIQKDRKQEVVTNGPYRIVRHPGYAAGIVSNLAAPLILGSWWGLIPASIIAIMLIIRTLLEDRTLQKELEGYKEYTKTTRYRLIPLVW